jgi:uncharacterized membrane protein YjgN (DUF898 family)
MMPALLVLVAVLLLARLAYVALRHRAIRTSGRGVRWEVPAVRWWRSLRGSGDSSKATPEE